MAAVQATENHGDKWGLTWYFLWRIYINSNLGPLTKFSGSSRNTKFKDIFPWNISDDYKDHPISMEIVISCMMKWNGASSFEIEGNSIETGTLTWFEFLNGGKAWVRWKKWIQKNRTSREVSHLSKVVWSYNRNYKIITEFIRSISSTRIG